MCLILLIAIAFDGGAGKKCWEDGLGSWGTEVITCDKYCMFLTHSSHLVSIFLNT